MSILKFRKDKNAFSLWDEEYIPQGEEGLKQIMVVCLNWRGRWFAQCAQ